MAKQEIKRAGEYSLLKEQKDFIKLIELIEVDKDLIAKKIKWISLELNVVISPKKITELAEINKKNQLNFIGVNNSKTQFIYKVIGKKEMKELPIELEKINSSVMIELIEVDENFTQKQIQFKYFDHEDLGTDTYLINVLSKIKTSNEVEILGVNAQRTQYIYKINKKK